MHYELRQCSEDDRAWAYALKCEAYRDVVERQFGPWDEDRQREFFRQRWNPAISQVIVVSGQAVGLFAVEDRPLELWIDEIQIVRSWQNRGVGTAMVKALISRASASGKSLRLQVLHQNDGARRLYDRLGFCVTSKTATHFVMEHGNKATEEKAS